jgi:hypothetical protein
MDIGAKIDFMAADELLAVILEDGVTATFL